jgi:hypothetical protein
MRKKINTNKNNKINQEKYQIKEPDADAILVTGEIDIHEELNNLGAWQDFQRESFHDGVNSY